MKVHQRNWSWAHYLRFQTSVRNDECRRYQSKLFQIIRISFYVWVWVVGWVCVWINVTFDIYPLLMFCLARDSNRVPAIWNPSPRHKPVFMTLSLHKYQLRLVCAFYLHTHVNHLVDSRCPVQRSSRPLLVVFLVFTLECNARSFLWIESIVILNNGKHFLSQTWPVYCMTICD